MPDQYVNTTGLQTYSLGPKDRSIASATGGIQLLMPANPFRRDFFINNDGAATIYVSYLTATVVASAVGVLPIPAGSSLEASMLGEMVPKGAFYVLGVAGQPIFAHETLGYFERA